MASKRKHEVTVEELREAFIYNPETGEFSFRVTKKFGFNANNRERAGSAKPGGHGYARLTVNSKQFMAHRAAWAIHYGEIPECQIDHIDRNKLNNRISNLRLATARQNAFNSPARGSVSAKGVTWHKRNRRYDARIKCELGVILLGQFETLDEAAHAYNKAAILHHGEFAVLNPIGQDKA